MAHEGNRDREREHTTTSQQGEEAGDSNRDADITTLAELALIYQHAPLGLCVLDRELRFVRINERLADMNGIPAADHVGRTVREVLPDLADTLEPHYRRVLETGMPALRVAVHGSTPQQPEVERNWLASYVPVRSPDGDILGIGCVVEEITQRTQAERELRRSEERYRSLVELSPDGIFVTRDGTIRFVNPAAVKLFGASTPADVIGRSPFDLFHADCHELIRERVARMLAGQIVPMVDHKIVRLDGTVRDVETSGTAMRGVDARAIQVVVRDITERRQIEEALRESEERLRRAQEAGRLGTWDWNVVTGEAAWTHEAWIIFTGQPGSSSAPDYDTWLACVHPDDRARAIAAVDAARESGVYVDQFRVVDRDGRVRWVESRGEFIFDSGRTPVRMLGTVSDISERRGEAERLRHQATHDPLTGLVNRVEFERRLQIALADADLRHPHALLFLDLDQFKVVNDTCGHVAGDALLRQIPSVLERSLRKRDTLARLGGDEFGVLLERCPEGHALRIAQQLVHAVQELPFVWGDKPFVLGASIGLVSLPAGGDALAEVMNAADRACYAAKEKGRNRVHVYAASDGELRQWKGETQWIPRLLRALAEDRFQLYTQPVVAVKDHGHEVHYLEVLLRLVDEHGALLLPDAFIPAAERYQQMRVLDRWVVRTAFLNLAARDRSVRYGINISSQSIGDEGFLGFLLDQLETAGVVPGQVCLEISEAAAVTDLRHARQFMQPLKDLGCSFALDDFGSGLASFGHLKTLPIDYLKIDGHFVKDSPADPFASAVVQAIHDIARPLGLRTIAESVESEPILERVKAIGIDFAQGHALAEPRPIAAGG